MTNADRVKKHLQDLHALSLAEILTYSKTSTACKNMFTRLDIPKMDSICECERWLSQPVKTNLDLLKECDTSKDFAIIIHEVVKECGDVNLNGVPYIDGMKFLDWLNSPAGE